MDLRSSLLSAVASPDRAWLTLLAGSMLIARECTAPGRVVPGLVGGILLITAAYHLPAAIPGLVGTAVLLYLQARRPAKFIPAIAAAALATWTARRTGASWLVASLSVVAVGVLAALIHIGMLAHRRKTLS